MTTPNVLIYTTPTCVYCREAKAFFQEHGVAYEEKDVSKDQEALERMVRKSEQMGVPVIEIGDQVVVGFNKPQIASLLGIKG